MKKFSILAASAMALGAAPTAAAETAGARVEALIGLDRAQLDSFGTRDDPSESGIVYGLGVGYDFAVGRGVSLGVDLEATESSARFREVSALDDNSYSLGRDLYAGARVTTSVSDAVNLYFKAGYTNLGIRRDLINPTFPEIIESNDGGLRGGAGVQIAVGTNAYVGTEYRFSTYDELDRHQALAALGFRF
ncbi:MAG TPA: outer membrane beta-barrel protein [Allosphingosinicella sp.]|nr:outer membrane beta-barrel protein [Allosphingosinicella sp.]